MIGSEVGLKSVIETAVGGPSLAQASAFSKLTSTAEPGSLANAYLSPEELHPRTERRRHRIDPAAAGGSTREARPAVSIGDPQRQRSDARSGHAAISLSLGRERIGRSERWAKAGRRCCAASPATPGWRWASATSAAHSATPHKALGRSLRWLGAINLDGIDFGKLLAPLSSAALNVQRDLFSWAGATGLYVSGSSILELKAAARHHLQEPGPLARRGGKARAGLPRSGRTNLADLGARHGNRGDGEAAELPFAADARGGAGQVCGGAWALPRSRKLSAPKAPWEAASSYSAAASALGQGIKPSALIEFHTLSGLLESLGLGQAPGISGFASAIAPLGTVTAGGGASLSDGVKRARVVIGFAADERIQLERLAGKRSAIRVLKP